jgi:hypothetical protein
MLNVTTLAAALQTLFTTTADQLARATRFIQRQRNFGGDQFAQVLVFEWARDPHATQETLADKLELTPQALSQRLDDTAWAFLKKLLEHALEVVHHAARQPQGILDRFTRVVVEDSTIVALPDGLADLFPGPGGRAAAVKILVRWDLRSGDVLSLTAHAGRDSDRHLAIDPKELPEGGLYLADLGFFRLEHRRGFPEGRYWVSRVAVDTQVDAGGGWVQWPRWLRNLRGDGFDGWVRVGATDPLGCRLVARRCPPAVAAERRRRCRAAAKRAGRGPASGLQLAACDWQVWVTNVPADVLSAAEVDPVYRCRWQVELFFKRAKSLGGWRVDVRRSRGRVLVELWATLLGVLVLHWGSLLRGGLLAGASAWRLMKVVREYAGLLRRALGQGPTAWAGVWEEVVERLARVPRQRASKRKPLTFQTLKAKTLAA